SNPSDVAMLRLGREDVQMDYGNGDVNEQDEIPPVKEERERAEAPREWRPNFDGDQQRKPGDARRELEIVDRGIQDVPLEKIDLRDSPVKGPEDFRKVSQSDLREGFSKLEQTVRPAVANGATQEDIAQIDQKDQTAADFQHSYARVYDALSMVTIGFLLRASLA
ncbi:MAG: hypothetical protein NTZ05_05735, partial [Chloroflexi bacterium]|nr:hypothetical protein [Chloroflexota bacterium]